MNRKEWLSDVSRQHNKYHYKYVRRLLRNWQTENNIPADIQCVIHHRDDTEECIKYNNEHYELWGFNEDGTFEYGKYVVFMTLSEHTTYHRTGIPLSTETRKRLSAAHKGKILSDECKAKIGAANKGRKHSDATKQKMSESHKGKTIHDETRAKLSAANKGRKHSDAARQRMSESHKGKTIPDETRAKLSAARKRNLIGLRLLYNIYKNNNGTKKWNDFQKAIYNGDITFEERPISVFL